jgi:hypothetical protein
MAHVIYILSTVILEFYSQKPAEVTENEHPVEEGTASVVTLPASLNGMLQPFFS